MQVEDCWENLHNQKIGFHDNNYEFQKSELCFVHVPKTAGTSIAQVFDFFQAEGLAIGNNYRKHIPISRRRAPSEFRYVTCHRDPVERVWSYFQMARKSGEHYPYFRYTVDNDIEHFMSNCWECRNMMTKYMTGELADTMAGDEVAHARKNMSHFYMVFDFDNLQKSTVEFTTKVYRDYQSGLQENQSAPSIGHERQSSYIEPTKQEIKSIQTFNALDIELYLRRRE